MMKSRYVIGLAGLLMNLGQLCQANEAFVPQNLIKQFTRVIVEDGAGGTAVSMGAPIFLYNGSDDSGELTFVAPLGSYDTLFELWGDIEGQDELELLDSKTMLAMPTVEFVINSQDAWHGHTDEVLANQAVVRHLYRTRADKPYSISATVSIASLGSAAGPSKVSLYREGVGANPVTYALDLEDTYFISLPHYVEMADAETFDWQGFPSLRGYEENTQMVGVERVHVETIENLPELPGGLVVGRASVQIWPQMRGFFNQVNGEGVQEPFAEGQRFARTVRDIYVHYRGIYPGSDAYVQIYKLTEGPDGELGPVVSSILEITNVRTSPFVGTASGEQAEQIEPRNTPTTGLKLSFSDMETYFSEFGAGEYQLAIRTDKLPFDPAEEAVRDLRNPEVEALINFTILNTVAVKATIGNVE